MDVCIIEKQNGGINMINEFAIQIPTKIVFGAGVISQVGDLALELGATKVMVVADKGVRATGIVSKVEEYLTAAKIPYIDFDKIVPNPRIEDCEEGAKIATKEGVNVLVTVGGGSSVDTAKAIAGMLGHGTTDFSVIKYPNPYTCNPLPLIAIPTTAGTGSEVTTSGVITDEKNKNKVFCYDPKVAPTVALADPEVLMGLPTKIAASTALDALTHAIEGYVAKCTCPLTEAVGLYAIKLLSKSMRKYIYDRDIDTCADVMMGSLLAGLSFGYSDTCAVHSLSETIGGEYDTPHGIANAIFLADVCEYSIPADMDKYADIALTMGVKGEGLSKREICQAGVEEIRKLVDDLMIPKFSEIDKVNPADFDRIAGKCAEHVSAPDNPRPVSKEDFLMLLNKAYEK